MQRASQILGRISAAPRSRKQADPVDPVIAMEQVACASWARAVGPRIARYSRAAKLVRNRLVVEVEDAVWQSNLFYLSHQIISNLAKELGAGIVTDLEFRIIPRRREPQRDTTAVPNRPLGGEVDESDAIHDPVLRRIYRAARRKETA
jgi:predicted nucleic acid-binding Zn ribbon protein